MGIQWRRIELSAADSSNGCFDPFAINPRLPFMSVDDVKTAPVPKLHVDLAHSILMVTGNDQPPALARKFTGEIQRCLRTRSLDDVVTPFSSGPLFGGFNGLLRSAVLRRDGDGGAHRRGDLQRKASARDRHHPRTGFCA